MVPVSSLLVQLFVYGHVFMSSQFPAAVSCNLLGSSAGVIPEWACSRKGLVFPECITPFQHLTQQLEGRVAASLILVGSMMILASPFVLCWIRHRNAETDEVLSAMQYVSRLLTCIFGYLVCEVLTNLREPILMSALFEEYEMSRIILSMSVITLIK
eukprot:173589_1